MVGSETSEHAWCLDASGRGVVDRLLASGLSASAVGVTMLPLRTIYRRAVTRGDITGAFRSSRSTRPAPNSLGLRSRSGAGPRAPRTRTKARAGAWARHP